MDPCGAPQVFDGLVCEVEFSIGGGVEGLLLVGVEDVLPQPLKTKAAETQTRRALDKFKRDILLIPE